MPRATVIVAAHRSPYLPATLRSLVAQTWDDFCVVVVDDDPHGSARSSVADLADTRFTWIPTGGGAGPAGSHRLGLAQASTDYVGVLNHDDVWEPEFLQRTVAVLDGCPLAVLCFTDHTVIDAAGDTCSGRSVALREQFGRTALASGLHQPFVDVVMAGSVSIAQASLFRQNALGEIPLAVGQGYDRFMALSLALSGGGAWFIDEPLAAWREHPENLTSAGRTVKSAAAGAALQRWMVRQPELRSMQVARSAVWSHLDWGRALLAKRF